jgi:hypothetical protein
VDDSTGTLMVVLFRRNNRDWQFGKEDVEARRRTFIKGRTRDVQAALRQAGRGTTPGKSQAGRRTPQYYYLLGAKIQYRS